MSAKSRADTRADIVTLELFTRDVGFRIDVRSTVQQCCINATATLPRLLQIVAHHSASSVETEDPSVTVQACSSSAAGAYLGCSSAHLGHTKLIKPY